MGFLWGWFRWCDREVCGWFKYYLGVFGIVNVIIVFVVRFG